MGIPLGIARGMPLGMPMGVSMGIPMPILMPIPMVYPRAMGIHRSQGYTHPSPPVRQSVRPSAHWVTGCIGKVLGPKPPHLRSWSVEWDVGVQVFGLLAGKLGA